MYRKYLTETIKYILIIATIVTLLVLNWKMWSKDYRQQQTIKNLKKELINQQSESNKMSALNGDLRRRIDSLKRGSIEMIEEEARDNFGMVGEGETFFEYKIEDKKPSQ